MRNFSECGKRNGKRKKRKSQVPGSGPRLESPIGHASDMDTMIYGLQFTKRVLHAKENGEDRSAYAVNGEDPFVREQSEADDAHKWPYHP